MADAWVLCGGGVRSSPMAATPAAAAVEEEGGRGRAQLAESLRLGQRSNTFLFDVLPRLEWLKLGAGEHVALLHFAAEKNKVG